MTFRYPAILLCLLFSVGCTASRGLYEEQLVRSQALEARITDLEARLELAREREEALSGDLEQCRTGAVGRDDALGQERERSRDLGEQLESCFAREESLRAELDLTRKSLGAAEQELLKHQTQQEQAREACSAREQELQTRLEAVRGESADLRARIHVLQQQNVRVEQEKRERLDELSRTYEGLLAGMEEEIQQGRVTISRLRGQLSVNLLDEILFDSGSAIVKPEGQDVLLRLGELLEGVKDKRIIIEGHTDNVPISGELKKRFATNWELSAARAVSVVRYLDEVVGLDPARLVAAGYGEHRPAVSNDTPEQRALNRRIEMKLVPLEHPILATEPPPAAGASPEEGPGDPAPEAGEGAQPGSE